MIRVFVFTHFESARCLGSKFVHDFVPPVLGPCGLPLPDDAHPVQVQSSGQRDCVESTALAAEDRAEDSEVPKFQREPIRTRRSRLSLWCRSKRVYARVKMMGFELSLKKIARSAKLQECSGMIPTPFTNILE